MNRFVHVGFECYVEVSKIVIILPLEKDKLWRELKKRDVDKNSDAFWNACGGKEAKSLLCLTNGVYVASAINTQTLARRINEQTNEEKGEVVL